MTYQRFDRAMSAEESAKLATDWGKRLSIGLTPSNIDYMATQGFDHRGPASGTVGDLRHGCLIALKRCHECARQ